MEERLYSNWRLSEIFIINLHHHYTTKKGATQNLRNSLIISVGVTGFEPATTRPPGVYATGLRYTPLSISDCPISDFGFKVCPIRNLQSNNPQSKVGSTGFEPVTSALSKQRSKPTELTTRLHFVLEYLSI